MVVKNKSNKNSSSSFDKKRPLVILGVTLVVLVVLGLVLFSPTREALFGKAIDAGVQAVDFTGCKINGWGGDSAGNSWKLTNDITITSVNDFPDPANPSCFLFNTQNKLKVDCDHHTIRYTGQDLAVGAVLQSSTDVTLENCIFEGFSLGVSVSRGSNNVINDNSLIDNFLGMYLLNTEKNIFNRNLIDGMGQVLISNLPQNVQTTISSLAPQGTGLIVRGSKENIFVRNHFLDNTRGVSILDGSSSDSVDNSFINNQINNNHDKGILIGQFSYRNYFLHNEIKDNANTGVDVLGTALSMSAGGSSPDLNRFKDNFICGQTTDVECGSNTLGDANYLNTQNCGWTANSGSNPTGFFSCSATGWEAPVCGARRCGPAGGVSGGISCGTCGGSYPGSSGLACNPSGRCSYCGNSVTDAGETCDDGNFADGDGCSSSCQTEGAVCGNGVIETGEQCDGTNLGVGVTACSDLPNYVAGNLFCDNNCQYNTQICIQCTDNTHCTGGLVCLNAECVVAPECGDGQQNQPSEQCDDGNILPGDGCDANCRTEVGDPNAPKFHWPLNSDVAANNVVVSPLPNSEATLVSNNPVYSSTGGVLSSGAFTLNGGDYIVKGYEVDNSGSYTVSFWANLDSTAAGEEGLFQWAAENSPTSGGPYMLVKRFDDRMRFWIPHLAYSIPDNYPESLRSGPLVTGRLYNFVMVKDGNNFRSYIDGARIGEASLTEATYRTSLVEAADALYFGNGHGGDFNGVIDEIKFYERALPDSEILAAYNALIPAAVPLAISSISESDFGTTSATLTVVTNVPATCEYKQLLPLPVGNFANMGTTGGINHRHDLTGLTADRLYKYQARCTNAGGSVTRDFQSFSTNQGLRIEPSTTATSITDTGASLLVITNEPSQCAYSTVSGSYSSMTPIPGPFAITSIQALTGLTPGSSNRYFVTCVDQSGSESSVREINFDTTGGSSSRTIDLSRSPRCQDGVNVCEAYEHCSTCPEDCNVCSGGADTDSDNVPDAQENSPHFSSSSADSDGDGINDNGDYCPGTNTAYPGFTASLNLIASNGCPNGDMAGNTAGSVQRPDGCFNDDDTQFVYLLYNPTCTSVAYGTIGTAGSDDDGDGILNENDFCPGTNTAYPGFTASLNLIASNGCPIGDIAGNVGPLPDGCFNDDDTQFVYLLYSSSCVSLS
jgi:cysteine-rich repeat protein